MINTPITPGSPFVSGTVDEAFVDADMPVVTLDENFVIPFRLEDAVFGQLDSIYVLSGPNEPSDLGFQQYHPPAGLSSDGNKNFGPGTLTEPTTYLGLITAQAGTNYWPLKVARADGVGEPDQIGTDHMTMRSGNSTLSAGQGPNGVDCIQLIEADSEYYETTNSVDWASTWSVSFWHKMATAASTVPILMSTGTASTNGWYLIHRDDRSGLTNQFTVGGSTYYMDFGTLDRNIEADGLWHHIAVTRQYNATATLDTFRLYLDGIKVATATRATIGNVDMGVSKLSLGDRLPATGSTLTCPGQYVHAARALGTVWSDAQVAQQAFWSGV
jgi:hypothetical protein